jgi:N-acetyl-beta-hexosaminidase
MHCVLLWGLAAAGRRSAAPAPPPCAGDSNGAVTSSATFQSFPQPKLVPWPQSVSIWPREDGYFYPNSSTVIAVNGNATEQAALQVAAQLLASEIALVTGGALQPKVVAETKYLPGPHIHLFILNAGSLPIDGPEASEIRVETHGAVLTAASGAGMMSATATFLQLLEFAADTDGRASPKCSSGAPAWRLPDIDVQDSPAFGIRGVMVDAARAYLPLTLLKEIVVMCRLYKINHLHLHLSDDGSFTFPSTKYPELAEKAKFSYKLSELQELQAFAQARGIVIIGEMDVPGHSSGLTGPLPSIFGFPSKPSLDVVNFVDPAVLTAIQVLHSLIWTTFKSSM